MGIDGYPFYNRSLGSIQDQNHHLALLNILFEWLSPVLKKGSYVLELGSGTGWISQFVETRCKLVSTEYNVAGSNRYIRLFADAQILPFKDCVFDGIYMSAVFHHLRHRILALNEFYRCLKIGGRLAILGEVPCLDAIQLWNELDYLKRKGFQDEDGYTIEELEIYLRNCKFENIDHHFIKYDPNMEFMLLNDLKTSFEQKCNGVILGEKL
jgi:SAM-dependent methyltransferase